MFAINKTQAAFCGKTSIHIVSVPLTDSLEQSSESLDLSSAVPLEATSETIKDLFCTILDMTPSGRFVVATDSFKRVFLFEYDKDGGEKKWILKGHWRVKLRLVLLKFDNTENMIVMVDKGGDIYLSVIGLAGVSLPKRIMGHTSLIMDVILTRDNSSIITCDRDEKIRVSNFPMAYKVFGYILGHKKSVVNIALINKDTNLLSASSDGMVKFWKFGQNGPNEPLSSWNVLEILKLNSDLHNVKRMTAMNFGDRIFVAFLIYGYNSLTILELKDMTLTLVLKEDLSTELVDWTWLESELSLYVYLPESPPFTLKFTLMPNGQMEKDTDFDIKFTPSVELDIYNGGNLLLPKTSRIQVGAKRRHYSPPPNPSPGPALFSRIEAI